MDNKIRAAIADMATNEELSGIAIVAVYKNGGMGLLVDVSTTSECAFLLAGLEIAKDRHLQAFERTLFPKDDNAFAED